MPNALTYRRRLRLFAKDEASRSVCVSLVGVVALGDGQERTFPLDDEYPDDAELTARAESDGRSTWDEDDLCVLLDCERGPQPAIPAAAPEPPTSATATPTLAPDRPPESSA